MAYFLIKIKQTTNVHGMLERYLNKLRPSLWSNRMYSPRNFWQKFSEILRKLIPRIPLFKLTKLRSNYFDDLVEITKSLNICNTDGIWKTTRSLFWLWSYDYYENMIIIMTLKEHQLCFQYPLSLRCHPFICFYVLYVMMIQKLSKNKILIHNFSSISVTKNVYKKTVIPHFWIFFPCLCFSACAKKVCNIYFTVCSYIKSHTRFRENPHTIVALMSRNSLLKTGTLSEV